MNDLFELFLLLANAQEAKKRVVKAGIAAQSLAQFTINRCQKVAKGTLDTYYVAGF